MKSSTYLKVSRKDAFHALPIATSASSTQALALDAGIILFFKLMPVSVRRQMAIN